MGAKSLRKYNPAAVKRSHIPNVMLLYGSDSPGITLRMQRFAELLEESGEDPAVMPNVAAAVGYLATGNLFSETTAVLIMDVSDALKSSSASERLRRQLIASIEEGGSVLVMAAPSSTPSKAFSKLSAAVEAAGGLVRAVDAGTPSQATQWVVNYLSSAGLSLSPEAISAVCSAAQGNPELMEKMILSAGSELANLSTSEIRAWVSSEEQAGVEAMRAALAGRRIEVLASMRSTYPPGQAGYRSFLLKLRYAALDLMLAVAPGDSRALDSFKKRQHGWDVPAWKIRKLVPNATFAGCQQAYASVCREIENISGASRGAPSLSRLLAEIAACPS